MILSSLLLQACAKEIPPPSRTFDSLIAYFETVNSSAVKVDPQVIFVLMGQYLNANQQVRGMAYYSKYLRDNDPQLSGPYRALYLSALALLRASHAQHIPLLDRTGWVRETIAMLEEAKRLSANRIFLVRWIAGIVYARIPSSFGKEQAALVELNWCVENISKAPHEGWAREVYFHLALVHRNRDEADQAQAYLQKSRYSGFDKAITTTTPYAVSAREGLRFRSPRIREVVPGRVFAISGFEFTEYYFIISGDGKELIAIDAGARPDSAEAVIEALKRRVPNLPPLTTVFVTHAHWDHVGGQGAFRRMYPDVRFFIRDNYQDELKRSLNAPGVFSYFFGSAFKIAEVADFKPEVTVRARRGIRVGGTRFELIPVPGGETSDGMFIYLPEFRLLFAGDFIMPYLGAPFLEQGSLRGLTAAIDIAVSLKPRELLHGHEPLTRLYPSTALLQKLKPALLWLENQVQRAIRQGKSRAEIHHLNLIPPGVLEFSELQMPFIVMRENFINRIHDQTVGYWRQNLGGMDHLSPRELGSILSDYLGIPADSQAEVVEKMAASGDLDLAARTILWARARHPENQRLRAAERKVFLKLKEKYQELNPFKFIIYSERIGHETPQLEASR